MLVRCGESVVIPMYFLGLACWTDQIVCATIGSLEVLLRHCLAVVVVTYVTYTLSFLVQIRDWGEQSDAKQFLLDHVAKSS